GATVLSIISALGLRFDDAVHVTAAGGFETVHATSDAVATGPGGPEFIVRADRSHAAFQDQISHALAEIEAGRMAKIVLARSLSVEHDADIEVPSFLERLRSQYPSCTLVAIGRGKDTFLAATPETLVRVEGDEVESAALAGSAPRGRHPEEDEVLGQALLDSEKENQEHAHVVAQIRGVVEGFCHEFEISAKPTLRKLVGIQHLETRLRGRLRSRPDGQKAVDVLELVEALHPTPAVGGVPAANAAAWLRRFEGLDRGWYAAPVGWLDREGGGDFCVALRSALIRNGLGPSGESGASRALLFAGAGIVSGSDPRQELMETRIKLRALLALMTEI
ncbi:MAG: isochorismate synthase, partial [Myxococcota bacterium]